MQINKWFVLAVRSIAALLLFIAAGVIISILNPAVTPDQQEKYLMGMMKAMMNTLMCQANALSNGIHHFLFIFLTLMVLVLIPLSIGIGLFLRKSRVNYS
ncbi:hypothetical protein P5G65_23610 [Paenibacillus chondroitinus]|uniref:Uncharacterized protein n=1 Tax=Paenibacillus chondroitinus TaxID=59842 RepID=A0ABU6DIS2_9BACL|nr:MULTISPECIES: hypothetical protein [Paenibacillus]MCY9659498.1 hypothetical protein [Paenibacillus anseongense]MEB4796893.1 hypothetical protein [Paenibacillus chondroitinus]